ncbi:MAG: hypothetical protein U0271_17380 [Polyangiaceae bacterium]
MALSFNPLRIDFGALAPGQVSQRVLVITNPDSAAVTITAPNAPFSMAPATVEVAANGQATVTILFRPLGTGTFSGSVTSSAGSCALTGSADTFEAQGDSTSTDDSPFGTNATGIKHFQAVVPHFTELANPGLVPTQLASGGPIPTFSGSSFLRIGSNPSTSDWSDALYAKSVALTKLAADPSAIITAEGIALSEGRITTSNTDSANASTLGSSTSTAFTEGFADGAGVPGPYGYTGDPNYLLGYADDTRWHSSAATLTPAKTRINDTEVDNLAQNRQSETLRLAEKGGHWDHTDGNRITTTGGDKLEVIGGNYKMIVLGRQAMPTTDAGLSDLVQNALVTDVSGGHFQEQYPSPTPCIKTTELAVDQSTGEWTLYQDNGVGNLITKLKGRTVDLFQGKRREVYVGTKDGTAASASLDPVLISKTWAKKTYATTGTEAKPIGAGTTPTGFPTAAPNAATVSKGDVCSVTWAQRILSYTGSSGHEVPYIYSEHYSKKVKSVTRAEGDVVSLTTVKGGDIVNRTKVLANVARPSGGKLQSTTAASVVINLTRASADVIGVNAVGGVIGNVNSAVSMASLNSAGTIANFNVGAASVFNLNLGISMFNIDLTPVSVHAGAFQHDLAVQWYSAAPITQEGGPPLPAAIAVAVVASLLGGLAGGLLTLAPVE